jgi:chromate transporter
MLLRMGVSAVRTTSKGVLPIAVMVAVFVAIGVLKWPLVPVVLVATPLSVLAAWPRGRALQDKKEQGDA